MVLFSVGLAFLLGYAVLKAKGVWIAAFLHALVNQSFGLFHGCHLYTHRCCLFIWDRYPRIDRARVAGRADPS